MRKLVTLTALVSFASLALVAQTINGVPNQVVAAFTGHQLQLASACADSSGSGTAQSCSTGGATFTPAAYDCVLYSTTTTNSGTGLTTNVNSLGAKSIAIAGASGWTTTLTASIIPANKPQLMCYDGTNWDDFQTGTASAGGSFPTGATGNGVYYSGTNTGASTAAIDFAGASAGSAVGIGQAIPQATLDVSGGVNFFSKITSAANAVQTNITATSTSVSLASCTPFNANGGYAILGVNNNPSEIAAYSSCSGTTMTFSATATGCSGATPGRGCFGTTAASQTTSAQVVPYNMLYTNANTSLPWFSYFTYQGSTSMLWGGIAPNLASNIPNYDFNGTLGATQIYLGTSDATANFLQGLNGSVQIENSAGLIVGQTDSATPTVTTTTQSISTTGVTTALTNLALSVIQDTGNVSYLKGECHLGYSQSTGAGGVQFGISQTNAATDVWVIDGLTWNGTALAAISPLAITSGTAVAITGTITPAAVATQYWVNFSFTVKTNTSSNTTVQITGGTANGSDALVIAAGSSCGWRT